MKAFVLAAGYATRLWPLTRDRPKPLLEVGGRPLLDHLLERLAALEGLSEVVVVSNARFAGAFRRWAEARSGDVRIRVLDDGTRDASERLGAIGDLAFALRRAPVEDDDVWIATAGDHLLRADLRPPVEACRARGTPQLLVRHTRPKGGPSPYNEVLLDEGGRVLSFREKPADPRGDLAAVAFYVFPARCAAGVHAYLEAGGNPDAPGHFVSWLVEREPVHAVPLDGSWHDVGSRESLAEARRLFEGASAVEE